MNSKQYLLTVSYFKNQRAYLAIVVSDVKGLTGAAPTWYILCTLVLLEKNSIFQKTFLEKKLIVGCLTGYKVEVVASLAKKDLTPDMTR